MSPPHDTLVAQSMLTHERHMSRSFQKLVSTAVFVTVMSTGVHVPIAFAQQPIKSTPRVVMTDMEPIFLPLPGEAKKEEKKVEAVAEKPKVIKSMRVHMTSYTSSRGETDSTPFIAADGTRTYSGMAAANFLPFGTKFRIPEHFGDKIFTVHDRMNPRYQTRVDIWQERKVDAKKFGIKKAALIEIIEMGTGKTPKKALK